jgi:hypothetical protein
MKAYKKYRQWLFCIFMLQSTASMATTTQDRADTLPPPQVYTVANVVLDPATPDQATVTFFQSARFYRLIRKNKNYTASLRLLQQAKKKGIPVNVYLTEAFGDTIKCVTLPTKKTKR